jgi:hypothetical protein
MPARYPGFPAGWAEHGALANARATFRARETRAGKKNGSTGKQGAKSSPSM